MLLTACRDVAGRNMSGRAVTSGGLVALRLGACSTTELEAGRGLRGMATAKKGKAKKARSGKAMDQKTANLLKLLDARPSPMPELSPEEKQRNFDIGRRYNSKMATEHNKRMAGLTMKIKLRDDAIAHLPELLQHAARQKDRNPPPLNRRVATYTPPIPNFNPRDYAAGSEDDAEAKLDRLREGY